MRNFLIGAAAIAMAASGAVADPGKDNGGGAKGDRPAAAMKQQGGKPDHSGHGPAMREAKADRGPAMKAEKPDPGPQMRAERKMERGNEARSDKRDPRSAERRDDRIERRVEREVSGRVDRRYGDRDIRRVAFNSDSFGLIEGCPPGLAKKNNGCMPPGLANKRDRWSDDFNRPSWFGYRSLGDGRYQYDDGYLYRMNDGGSILGYIPLLGGALSVGNPWPSFYQPAAVPDYYVDYYDLGPSDGYRYADDVLYRVDPETSAISSIAALLTGDQFAVGQPAPRGYDIYNVPYSYRDRYYDTPEAQYRYSDGYVYQIDPTTQLVAAAIQLLT